MKDRIYLLLTAIIGAVASWAFLHYLGNETGLFIVSMAIILCLMWENRKLKRRLEAMEHMEVSALQPLRQSEPK